MVAGISRRLRLLRHPQSGESPALEISIDAARDGAKLILLYAVRGDVAAVALPKQAEPARAHALWQHTCFEAFVRSAQSAAYWEFNFSPSREWAAWRFDGYRDGMAAEPGVADPHIEVQVKDSELQLSATLNLSDVAGLSSSDHWHTGISAVIESEKGGKSYWALAHPDGNPDFHHRDGFVLMLPPETR